MTPLILVKALSRRSLSDAAWISRRAALISSGLLAGSLLLVLVALIHIAQQQDAASLTREKGLVAEQLARQRESLERTVQDYAAWGEAYDNLSATVNVDWAYERGNLGRTLYNEFYINQIFVIAPNGETTYAVDAGNLVTPPPTLASDMDVMSVVDAARKVGENETRPVSRFVEYDDKAELVAAAAFSTADDSAVEARKGPSSVLVFVDTLDSQRLGELGSEVFVRDLRIAEAPLPAASVPVPGAHGGQLAFTWTAARPGSDLLVTVLPWLAVGAVALGVLAWATQRGLARGTEDLDRSRRELEVSEHRFRDVAEAASDWIWEADPQLRIVYLSERFEVATGRPRSEIIGKPLNAFLQPEEGDLRWLWRRSEAASARTALCRYAGSDGEERLCRLSGKAIWSYDHQLLGFRGVASDVTHEVAAQNKILYLSRHDLLTGLPNRLSLQDKMQDLVSQENSFLTIYLDLDNFKAINDTLGHRAGDAVLSEIGCRLVSVTPEGGVAARIGGDEFVIIAPGQYGVPEIQSLFALTLTVLLRPIQVEGQDVQVGGTAGTASFPEDGTSSDMLLRAADIALYEAKRVNRGQWKAYNSVLGHAVVARRQFVEELKVAVARIELVLHYQPRFNTQTGAIAAVEALVRWQHPRKGLVLPGEFIPVAEECGLIEGIGEWVLRTACQQIAPFSGLRVSVNVSPAQATMNGTLLTAVPLALASSRLPPARLELEFTEGAVLQGPEEAGRVLTALKGLGVQLSVDDFGTGYSSLGHLQLFPFDRIKLDRVFIAALQISPRTRAIVRAVLTLAEALGMAVTAEGVETEKQLQGLRNLGCEEVQGYLLAKPMPLEDLSDFLTATPRESHTRS